MNEHSMPAPRWSDPFAEWFLRLAASGWIPAKWFLSALPPMTDRAAKTGRLNLEIVSHCWNYAHLLVYQLSSLVNFPPGKATVTMTVYYCREDRRTVALLEHFSTLRVSGVVWNWRELPRRMLFRRAIGRNHAARNTTADWIWFADCDLMFREGCLDALVDALQGRRDTLVFPRAERCTLLLDDTDPMIAAGRGRIDVLDVDTGRFNERTRTRAVGPLQITHGDIARSVGYCECLPYYQRPSDRWCKCHEDRAFRWLLRTRGVALNIPGVYRIRHASKGRDTGSSRNTRLRSRVRRLRSR